MSEEEPTNWIDSKTGMACAVVTGPVGALNGYVAVAPTHPWFGKNNMDALCGATHCYDHTPDGLIDVHGGITYAGTGVRGVETNEGRWWFGFDTAHAGDFVPGLGAHFDDDVERTYAYVRGEVESMARQLAAVTPTTGTTHG